MSKIDARINAQVLSLNVAIDYQDESIVSQTLVGKETGTVTLFAFAQGEGLSLVIPGFIPSPLGEIVEYMTTWIEWVLLLVFGRRGFLYLQF